MTGSCSIHILKAERRCQYEIRSKGSPISCGSPQCISGTDAEMDAEPVGVCAGTAHAVYFRLRLYTLYCQEWLQFLILLVAEFGCFALIFMGALIVDAAERFNGWVAGL